MRYGGNTSCVVLNAPDHDPITFDMGTGLRVWGQTQPLDGSFRGTALVTHVHFDHVQGLPFFAPADRPGARFDVYGPPQEGRSLAKCFSEFCCQPYFPISVEQFRGTIKFHAAGVGEFQVGRATVLALPVPHVGPTVGYRVTIDGVSVVYISDHQQPLDRSNSIAPEVLQLCENADLVIHDAQYTPAEWEIKAHWGHCTIDYAMHVASSAGAKALALFHHDPGHGDDYLDALGASATKAGAALGLKVITAREGLTVSLGS